MSRAPAAIAILAVMLVLALPATGAGQNKAPTPEQIDRSISAGIAYLKQIQTPRGYWVYQPGLAQLTAKDIGATAFAGLTLLEAGVPAEDKAIQRAAAGVRQAAPHLSYTYGLSLAIMFLDRLGEKEDAKLIAMLAARLLAGQDKAGGWTYFCPLFNQKQAVEYLDKVNRGLAKPGDRLPAGVAPGGGEQPDAGGATESDNSNTQFAILALWIARSYDVPVEQAARLVDQRYRGSQHRDGGWTYFRSTDHTRASERPPSNAAMTCAGLLGLAFGYGSAFETNLRTKQADPGGEKPKNKLPELGDLKKDKVVLAARKLLAQSMEDNQMMVDHSAWPANLYFLWSLERVCVVYDWTTIEDKDWYAWGATYLVAGQLRDGSWRGKPPEGIDINPGLADTCFALLFLKKSNLATDLTAGLKGEVDLQTGGLPKKPKEPRNPPNNPVTAKPLPDKDPPAATIDSIEVDALKLGRELVSATGDRQEQVLQRLVQEKGGHYTLALADSIPRLSGASKEQARAALAERLARMKPDTIREYLKQEDPELRRAAAWAIAQKEARALVPELIELLNDADRGVAGIAYAALKELTKQDFGQAPERWQAWWKQQN